MFRSTWRRSALRREAAQARRGFLRERLVKCRCQPSVTSGHSRNFQFYSDCGQWYLRNLQESDVPAVAEIQTDAFHEEYAFQPIDAAFKSFFKVSAYQGVLNRPTTEFCSQMGITSPDIGRACPIFILCCNCVFYSTTLSGRHA
jgi:hypothetical protein